MDLVRISVTTLEEFRRYKTYDYVSEERMINRITGVREHSDRMNYGSDLWKYVESPDWAFTLPTGAVRMPTYDTYLPKEIVAKLDEYRASLQSPTFEVKVTARYEFKDLPPIVIVGQMDVLEADIVRDGKTTGQFQYESYEESLQWRFYLDMLGLNRFVYDVFDKKGKVDDPNGAKDDNGNLKQWPSDVELHSFEFFSYPNLKKDCRAWIAEYMAFVQLKGLTEFVYKPFEDDKDFTTLVYDENQFE